MNRELPDVQAGFRKGRGTRDQIASILWIIEKATEFQKNIYFCFIAYAKAFHFVDHNKLWKIPQEMGIPEHLTGLLRNLYAGQEATVRTGHGTTDWFQIGKGLHQGCILSPCLFNLYAEYIMQNARLNEAQAGVKISGRNASNLRHTDDTQFSSAQSLSHVQLFVTPWTIAHQASLSMGFLRQDHWVSCHFLLQRILPTHGSNLGLLHYRQILTI